MKLLERYSLASGLKIGKQFLLEKFYPLPFERYITLQAGTSQNAAKNYPYYKEVVELLSPYLSAANIRVVQIGGSGDAEIPGCHYTMKDSSLGQASHILRGSLLHFGNDSIFGHRAGYFRKPLVLLWGCTSPNNHSPYEYDPNKTIHLESHRWGRKAAFVQQESPLTIALIDPYDVARAVLKLLDIEHTITQRTINVGPVFTQGLLELVPNCVPDPNFQAHLPLVVRYDLAPNEGVLAQVLSTGRKVNIVAKTPINPNLLAQFRASFASFNHEVDLNTPIDYVMTLKKVVPNAAFFTRETDAARIADIRFRLFDIVTVQQHVDKTKADFEGAAREYLNDPAFVLDNLLQSGETRFKSNKLVLSNGKVYASLAHEARDIPMGVAGHDLLIDDPAWWRDLNHYLVYR